MCTSRLLFLITLGLICLLSGRRLVNLLHVLTSIDLGTLFIASIITIDNRLCEVGVLHVSVAQDRALAIVTRYLIVSLIDRSRSILIKWNGALICYER